MIKRRRQIIAACLLAIYSLVAALLCNIGYDLYSQKSDVQQNSAQEFYSVITGSQAGGALQPKKQVVVTIIKTDDDVKKLFNEFPGLLQLKDQIFSDLFTHHSSPAVNIFSQVLRSAIIFPFHHFW